MMHPPADASVKPKAKGEDLRFMKNEGQHKHDLAGTVVAARQNVCSNVMVLRSSRKQL
ncbi:hypothetical protein H6F86_18230 [Phormidium sp. FACHB-592]|uniref:hypothetical protein n=1 Tax=Phormidium sp. FACHB-592 TaxID=2692850 RepID=UPI001689EFC1|nr:hypothetical protein [Phormidium sp. FACHB-592]MBD2075795.1 hypothetical protein [Phormidium sp. FACHB-592]